MPEISKYSPDKPFVPHFFSQVNLSNAFIPSVTMPDTLSPSHGVGQGNDTWSFFLQGGSNPFKGIGVVPGAPAAKDDYWKNQKFSSASDEYQSGNTYKDIGFLIGRDNEDLWAKNRSWWDETFNTVVRLVDKAGAYTVQGFGFLGGLVGIGNKSSRYHSGSNFADWIAGASDNGLAAWARDVGEDVDNLYRPVYNEASDRDAGFFRRMFTDLEFWKGDVVDGAAFLTSAYLSGNVFNSLNLGGAAIRGVNSWRGLQFADEAAALSAEGLTGASEAATLSRGATFAESGAPLTPNALSREAGDIVRGVVRERGNFANAKMINMGVTTLINTASESLFEASNLKNELVDQLMQEKNADGTAKYTPEQVRDLSAKAARNSFLLNMLVLAPSNLWEVKTFFGGANVMSGRNAGNKLVRHETGLLGDAELAKRTFGQKGWDYLKNTGTGILAEGLWEENIQLAIERMNQDPAQLDEGFFTNVGRAVNQYFKQTASALAGDDKEAAMNIGIGGLIGGGMGVRTRFSELGQLKRDIANYNGAVSTFRNTAKNFYELRDDGGVKFDNNGNPVINQANVLSFIASMNKTLSMDQVAESLKAKNMGVLHSIVDNENIARLVKAYADNGMVDQLIDKVNNAKGFKTEDLSMLGLNADNAENSQRLEDVKAKIQQHRAIYDNIQKNFNVRILRDDKNGSKASAMKQTLYYLSTRAGHLASLKDKIKEDAETTSNEIAARYSAPTDGLVDQLNDLNNRYQAAKKRHDYLSNQQLYLPTTRRAIEGPTTETVELGNGVTLTKKKPKPVVSPEEIQAVNEQDLYDAVQNMNNAESALKEFMLSNKDEIKNIRQNADGSFRYEIPERNRLTYQATDVARNKRVSADIEEAYNATLNVYNRISDVKFGEKYWDTVYGRRKQALQDELEMDDSTDVEEPLPDEPNPTPPVSPEETISPEQAERMSKDKKDMDDLYEEEFDLEREKEFLNEKEEVLTPEEQARVEEIEQRLDDIQKLKQQKRTETDNEHKVDESENIKPEDKQNYLDILNKIAENKKRVKKFNTHYEVDGESFRKVSELIGDNVTVDQSAANKGYTVDAIVKAFFAGEINDTFKKEMNTNISEEAFDSMVKQLESIKAALANQGIEIIDSNVIVFDEDLKVAGEIDLLGVDKKGNFKIYEISARRPEVYRAYGKAGKGISIRELDGKRLSSYRNIFANQYGAIPDEISVMFPFAITYDKADPNGFITKAKLKDKIRFMPERQVEVKLKNFQPVRPGSKFDNFDLFTLFSRTFIPTTMQVVRDKMNFLLRNETFDNIKKNLTLTVSNLEGELLDKYTEQQKLLAGQETKYKPNKAAYLNSFGNRVEFDNLYALRNSKSMALYYDKELVGYMSPIPALAYKDENGKFKILDHNTDKKTYTELTGNAASTYEDFKKLSSAYTSSYNNLISKIAEGTESVTLNNKELQELLDITLSYGELDLLKSNQSRPALNELDFRGVRVGSAKNVVTVVNLDDNDGVKVIMDKNRKTKSAIQKIQDIDRWVNNNLPQVKKAATDKNGKKVTNWLAVIETPNGELKLISLREKGNIPVDLTDDFVHNLGDKFTASTSTSVFKNSNMQVIPKVSESSFNIDLKDAEILGKVYNAEDVESIEKFGMDATDLNIQTNEEKVNDFINNLTPQEFSDINSRFATFEQTKEELANDIIDDYNAGMWSSVDDYLNDLKNCP